MPAGFHTVNLPKKGDGPLPLIVPTGQKVAGVDRRRRRGVLVQRAGRAEPQPARSPRPPTARSSPTRAPSRSSRGLPASEKPKPMTVKFTKAGTYKVYCDLHPGMAASVTVAKKGAEGPDRQAGRGRRQEAGRRRRQGRQGPRDDQPGRQHRRPRRRRQGRRRVPRHGARQRSPSPPGTTVKFQMTKGSYEAHTATFGPGNIERPVVLPRRDRGLLRVTRDRPAGRRTRATSRRSSLSPTTHGNGFWNSGVLDAGSASPLPESVERQVRHAPARTRTTA